MHITTRRAFLRDATLMAVAVVRPLSRGATRFASPVRIGVLNADESSSRRLGLTLGIEEARHAAAMFGGDVQLNDVRADMPLHSFSAIIGDRAMSRVDDAAHAGIPYINVACSGDEWRGARCAASLFHVIPSDTMTRDALTDAHAASGARVEAWDASLEKFGADTLNDRFRARFNQPMSSDAWLGWFAVKALWESSLRARSSEAGTLRDYLAREATQFDGHKGRPLSFRSWDRQLRQPVYLVAASRITEWPPVSDAPARESLDRIGTTSSASQCHA